jgi:hypothetical protein
LTFHLATISAALRPSVVVIAAVRNTYGCRFAGAVSWSVFGIGATKTILFSFAIVDTAGPSADVSAFIEHLKKLRSDVEIVDQQWPKLGEGV